MACLWAVSALQAQNFGSNHAQATNAELQSPISMRQVDEDKLVEEASSDAGTTRPAPTYSDAKTVKK
nr:hypothetical protein [Bacteroides xylanisolvens]